MKKVSRFLWTMMVFLAAGMIAVMVAGCPDKEDENGTGTGGTGTGNPTGTSGTNAGNPGGPAGNISSDWSIAAGANNSITVEDNTLVVKWKAPGNWDLVEAWGKVPASVNVAEYDGLQFDIKIDTANNYAILIRPQGSVAAWKLAEPYISESNEWQTVSYEFDPATAQWGEFSESTLAEWLTGNATAADPKTILVYIAPVLNPGNPADDDKKNNQFTTYLRNIGFYKDSSDDVTLVW